MVAMPRVIWTEQSRALSMVLCMLENMSWFMGSAVLSLPKNMSMAWLSSSNFNSKVARSVRMLLGGVSEVLG